MARLILIRHGNAAAGFDADADPGLDETGRAQAEAMAAALAAAGPLPILVSPLRRTRETAAALEHRWKRDARVEPRIAEIPSPTTDLKARGLWLREIAPKRWPELGERLQRWRDDVIETLLEIKEDSALVTHFIPINVAVGSARDDDRLISFQADNCSRTVLDNTGGRLAIVALGAEGTTRIL